MTFWRRFRTDPFVGTLVLGLLMATWTGSAQAQEARGDPARSPYGTLMYKSISKGIETREAAREREAIAAQPLVAPANDDFANAIALEGQQGSVSGTNVDATAEPGEPPHAGVAGISSVWYTFTPDEDGLTFLDTFGSDFDTVLAVYTGDSIDALTEVDSNDDAAGTLQSQVVFLAQAGVTYSIAVDGFQGAQGNFILNFERTDQVAPENDDFNDAIALEGQQGSVAGNNIGATAEPGEPQHAGVAGISSVWYTFTPDQTGVTFLDTFGSDFDTVLAVYTGDQVDDLTEVVSNDDAAEGLFQSQVAFLAEAGVTYRIAIDGFEGAQGSFVLNFQNTNQPAPANDDFVDAIPLEVRGDEVSGNNFAASAESGEPVHALFGVGRSLWYTLTSSRTRVVVLRASSDSPIEDVPILPLLAVYRGATVGSLTEVASSASDVIDVTDGRLSASVPLAFLAEAGVTYRIAVDTDSLFRPGPFTLEFERDDELPPDNDEFDDAVTLDNRRGSVTGTNSGATREPDEVGLFTGFLGNTRSVWYTFTADRTGIATFDTFRSDFDTVLAVFQGGSIPNAFPVALNDDAGNGRQSQVAFLAESGVTYHVAVDGFNNADGDFTLNFERTNRQSPGNDAFANARRLIGPRGNVSGLNVQATAQPADPVPSDPGLAGGSSVWWRWRAPFTGDVTFTTAGSTFDTVLAVYQGPTLSDLTEIASNDDTVLLNGVTIAESLVTFQAEEGELYHILVDGFAGDQGAISLAFTPGDAILKRGIEQVKRPPDEDRGPKG